MIEHRIAEADDAQAFSHTRISCTMFNNTLGSLELYTKTTVDPTYALSVPV